ncbi:DUF116 domain-containing protein [Petroclostridium xylanilyticum]|uniref:DUF116 domain-containing protein n=1 Tax=Petroclostridium xylanilyticum TaxID=1792311 RepID=UPI000B98B956|nr:DUF116 domain-containing protein [Petroclostridium xylanilyticum]
MDFKRERLQVFFKISQVFIALAFAALFIALMVYLYVDEVTYNLIMLILVVLVFIIILFSALLIYIIATAYRAGRINKTFALFINKFIKIVMSIAIDLVSILRIDKNIMRSFFVDINNIIVNSANPKSENDKILLLVPHCLQWAKCGYKVTNDPSNCKRCGKCDITRILDIAERYNIKICIASGGTMARKAIQENRTKLIISVACSRDLIHGILDIDNIPVIAIENTTPEGPCINTKVEVDKIEDAIRQVLVKNQF